MSAKYLATHCPCLGGGAGEYVRASVWYARVRVRVRKRMGALVHARA